MPFPMHELAVTQNIVDISLDAARAADAVRIRAIRVAVGALTGIAPDSVQFYFEFLRRDTLAADAHLEIEIVPARATCGACGAEFAVVPPLDGCCPVCGGAPAQVVGGNDLLVASIEVD